MAKDTEKLIRQLSLISYLMAERRPVTALEIRRDVEGYSGMNEDAFARRFYADRAELEGARASASRSRSPREGAAEQENYSLPPENFYLPAIAFTDEELAALQIALSLLDGEFAYAEPLRLALQQISWGRPSPLQRARPALGRARHHRLGRRPRPLAAPGEDRDGDLPPQDDRVRATTRWSATQTGARKVDPYHLLFRGGQFYLSATRTSARRSASSGSRGSAARSPTRRRPSTTSSAPTTSTRARYASRADWQLGDDRGRRRDRRRRAHRLAGRAPLRPLRRDPARRTTGDRVFETPYASARAARLVGARARASTRTSLGPDELVAEAEERLELLERAPRAASSTLAKPVAAPAPPAPAEREDDDARRREAAIRPERFARLVTLASILIDAGRARRAAAARPTSARRSRSPRRSCARTSTSSTSSTSAAAPTSSTPRSTTTEIEVDPEPYGDNFARPARLLPLEAKALVAAIDLIGDHLPEGALAGAREKIVAALGDDPLEQGLQIADAGGDDSADRAGRLEGDRRPQLLELDYYKENEDEFTERIVEPYALVNGREGWYVASFDPEKDDVRHFRLDRMRHAEVQRKGFEPRPEVDPAADVEGWPTHRRGARVAHARASGSPPSAPAGRARSGRVAQELADGALIVELPFAGTDWLVREVLKEAGDAVVLEPEDAREAVLAAARAPAQARARVAPTAAIGFAPMASKRDLIKLTDDEVSAFLAEQKTVIVASNGHRGWPHLMPLWFVVRPTGPGGAEELWGWTFAKSQKTKNLERDPRATLQVEDGEEYHLLRGVMLETEVVIHRDIDVVAAARHRDHGPLRARRRPARGGEGDVPQAGREARRPAVRRAAPHELGPPEARWRLLSTSPSCGRSTSARGARSRWPTCARCWPTPARRTSRRTSRAGTSSSGTSRRTRRRCATTSSPRLEAAFGFAIPVILRRAGDLAALVAGNPFPVAEPTRPLVSFLRDAPPPGATGRARRRRRSRPRRSCSPGARSTWTCPHGPGAPSSRRRWHAPTASPETTRNWRTVLRLLEMAQSR